MDNKDNSCKPILINKGWSIISRMKGKTSTKIIPKLHLNYDTTYNFLKKRNHFSDTSNHKRSIKDKFKEKEKSLYKNHIL